MARYIDADRFEKEIRMEASYSIADAVIRIADRQPIADVVEVKYGEWVVLEGEIGLYSCSLCEHSILREKCNYCPNCGAKMDGGRGE